MSLYVLSQTLQAAINAGNPQRVLLEFYEKPNGDLYKDGNNVPAPVLFSNEDILMTEGIRLTSEFNSETDLTIGLCPSAQIRYSMLNDNGQLEAFEFGKFRAYLGAKIADTGAENEDPVRRLYPDGLYEFAPLGVFVAQRPDIVRKKIIEVDANDLMTLLDKELPSDVVITYPTTLYNIAKFICDTIESNLLKTNVWMNSGITVSAQPEQFTGATMREILGWIAEAACANAMFDREGKLVFRWFNPIEKVYNEHDYSEFTTAWYETKAIDSLHIRNADSTAENTFYPPESETNDNAYMIQDNPFLRQPESP